MKKYLSLLCILASLSLTAFTSCGDSSGSSDSSEVSESSISETTTEEETETATEKETTTQKQVYDLDYDVEFDNVHLSIPSFLKISDSSEEKRYAYLYTSWNDDNGKYHNIIFYFYKDPEMYCNGGIAEGGKFEEDKVTDRFTINGNEYMVTHGIYIPTTIFFTNETASGRIHYDDDDEELVKQIIETIEFTHGKTTSTSSEKVITNKKYTFGDISFELPENCEESEGTSTDTLESMRYTFEDESSLTVMSSKWSDYSLYESDDELKRLTFETVFSSFELNEPIGDSESIKINGEFALHQNASNMGVFNISEYIFCYKEKIYVFDFSDLTETSTQALDMQDEIIKSISFDTNAKKITEKSKKTTTDDTEKPTGKATEAPAPVNTGDSEALKSAKSYIDFSAFSYEGLISQLEYEGYSHDEAVSAANNCGADWNAEALESAKSYISMSGFSYTSLVSQLKYEKFTHEQAVYGADNCGADWNQQAADCARKYLNSMSMSREELLDQLLFEEFTQEQAEFGVQSVGY